MSSPLKLLYSTDRGTACTGDSLALLPLLDAASVDLVFTSPPFALQRKKAYGNVDEMAYADWLARFAEPVKRVLRDSGSWVLDLGGAYRSGRPVRSLYNYRVLLKLCDEHGFHLAQEFFWHNPAKLPSPIEWVNKRKVRVKDSVNTLWWLSKTEHPKADVRKVLVPYSAAMQKMMQHGYRAKKRPSGHVIGNSFGRDNGGAIPPNLLQIPNTDSNSLYLRACKQAGIAPHPARFPAQLPAFFINLLTDPGDTVLDIFAGSNTTGCVAEKLARRWIAFELNHEYLKASAFRFAGEQDAEQLRALWTEMDGSQAKHFTSTPA